MVAENENGDNNGKYARRKGEERWLAFIEKFAKLEVAVDRLTEHERDDRKKYEGLFENLRKDIGELKRLLPDDAVGRLKELEGKFSAEGIKLEERFKNLELRPEVGKETDTRIKWLERMTWLAVGAISAVGLAIAVFEFLTKWSKVPLG